MSKEIIRFTKKAIDELSIPDKGRKRVYDDKCRHLCVQITGTGQKSFYFYSYDPITKKPVQKKIGHFGDVAIELARSTAEKWAVEMSVGRLTGKKDIPTIGKAIDVYISNKKSQLAENTINSYKGLKKLHLYDWVDTPLDKITRQNVLTKFQDLSNYSESVANRTFRFLRAVYNEQMDLLNDELTGQLVLSNPVNILTRRKRWNKESPAQDWIGPEILPVFFNTLNTMRSFDDFYHLVADYFEFVLFTGLRRREASLLKIEDVNLESLIYKVKPKGKDEVLMPLTENSKSLLVKRINISKEIGSEYVFANMENNGKALNDPRRAMAYLRHELGIHITIHGLRRSFATYAESIDLSSYVIKRLMNHSIKGDVTAVHYIQRDMERLRSALNKVGNHLLSVGRISAVKDNVVVSSLPSKVIINA